MDQDMQQYLDKAEKCHQGCYILEIGWIQTDHRSRRWKRDQ